MALQLSLEGQVFLTDTETGSKEEIDADLVLRSLLLVIEQAIDRALKDEPAPAQPEPQVEPEAQK